MKGFFVLTSSRPYSTAAVRVIAAVACQACEGGYIIWMTGEAGCCQGGAAQSDAREAVAVGAGRVMRPRQRESDSRVIKCRAVKPGGKVPVAVGAI